MTALVVDASAALRLVAGGAGRDDVRTRLRDQILAGGRILVPGVFWLELVDALVERHGQRPAAVVEAIYELEQLGLETAEIGRPGVLAVIDGVGRGLRATDAAYLVLAESAGAALVTADARIASVAGGRAVLVAGRRARPPRPDRSWARWKGAVAYLRELRSSL